MEVAAGRRVDRAWHVTTENDPLAPLLDHGVRNGHRGEKRLGVGVERIVVERVAVGHLDDLAEVHHRNTVGNVLHHREVMGDEQVGEAELVLQVFEEVNDLGLDRNVQRRDGFVGDDEVGVRGEGAGDPDPLSLAAGELVRVPVGEVGIESDRLEQLLDPLGALILRDQPVDLHRLRDDVADRHPGVQRGVGVLKDHLEVAAHPPHVAPIELGQVLAVEDHLA